MSDEHMRMPATYHLPTGENTSIHRFVIFVVGIQGLTRVIAPSGHRTKELTTDGITILQYCSQESLFRVAHSHSWIELGRTPYLASVPPRSLYSRLGFGADFQ